MSTGAIILIVLGAVVITALATTVIMNLTQERKWTRAKAAARWESHVRAEHGVSLYRDAVLSDAWLVTVRRVARLSGHPIRVLGEVRTATVPADAQDWMARLAAAEEEASAKAETLNARLTEDEDPRGE